MWSVLASGVNYGFLSANIVYGPFQMQYNAGFAAVNGPSLNNNPHRFIEGFAPDKTGVFRVDGSTYTLATVADLYPIVGIRMNGAGTAGLYHCDVSIALRVICPTTPPESEVTALDAWVKEYYGLSW